jgi:protocatechuate 3,4-dioxygenase beta subunit
MRRRAALAWLMACAAGWCAEIEGVVLENASGRPVARAQVTLERVGGGGESRSTLSDSRGRFAFLSLPAGAYLLSARRSGYATARYGQRKWDGAGAPIVLDQTAQFFAELRLPRLGAITGQVTDENGLGLAGHAVYAYRAGERPLRMVAAANTDDRGVYRLAGLAPGVYYVRTGARQLEDGRGLLPTFYGQTTSAAEARVVEVALDRDTGGIDIEPLPGKLGRLSGRVIGAPATVMLYSETGPREMQTRADGSFLFDELAPGPYQLLALATQGDKRAAWQKLQVGEGEAATTLELAGLPSLKVECVEKGGRRVEAARTAVFLLREEPAAAAAVTVRGGETVMLEPGEYRVAVSAPLDHYVAYVRMPRTATGPARFEAPAGAVLEMTVILGARPGTITGRVVDEDGKPVAGAPVYLRPVDPEMQRLMDGGRSARCDQQGEFRFHGLAPGRYRLFSSFEIGQPKEADWESPGGEWVSVEEGETAKLELKLAGGM